MVEMWWFFVIVSVLGGVIDSLPQFRQEYVPVLSKSGVPVEPPEVRAARERHLKFLSAYQEPNFGLESGKYSAPKNSYQERVPIVKNRQEDDWDFGKTPNNGLYSYNIEHIYGGTEEEEYNDDGSYKEVYNYNNGRDKQYKQYQEPKNYDDGSYKSTKNEGAYKEPKTLKTSPLTFNDDEDYDDGSYKEEKYESGSHKEKKHEEKKQKKVESTTHYIPVIKNGVPVETKEVQEARLQHLTAHVRALERIKTIEENLSKQKKEDSNGNETKEPKKDIKNGKQPKQKQENKEEKKQSTQSFLKTICITMHICSDK